MAVKLIALYKKPDDIQAFDEYYFNVHAPLAEKMPGLLRIDYNRVTGAPMGNTEYHLIAELTFDSLVDLQAAMVSDEGKAAARDLMGFAGNLVHMVIAEATESGVPVEVQ